MKKFLTLFLLLQFVLLQAEDKSMIIVTTNRVENSSKMLSVFIEEKEKRGFRINMVTEDDFGGENETGLEKAKLIRKWLTENHQGYTFLLLIGNPDSSKGDIPMLETWPLHMFPETSSGPYPENVPVETDMFYGDLNGTWDLNGNGRFGETEFDSGEGGIDFKYELVTGRIPIYDNIEELDTTLEKTINYMNQRDIEYRKKVLFPAGFFFFRGELGNNDDWESAGLGEWAINNFLKNHSKFSYTTMYEEEGYQTTMFQSDMPLNRENMISEWNNGYGAVFVGGHGQPTYMIRTVWNEDSNGDDSASMSETSTPYLFKSTDSVKLNGDKPAFLISPLCNMGVVKKSGGFVHTLLMNGAVGMMGATEASTPSSMEWSCYECEWTKNSYGSDTAGIITLKALLDGGYPAMGLALSKSEYGNGKADGLIFANKMMFNWYGDPSLTIEDSAADIEPSDESDEEISVDQDSEFQDEEVDEYRDDSAAPSKKSSSSCSLLLF